MVDTVEELAGAACRGDRRALARLVSLVEAGDSATIRKIAAALPARGHARVIGVTGPPGAGKSTLVGAYVQRLRRNDRRVAVLAIDPSSPLSGGALLGDRIRLGALTTDPDVFIRSMATRGHLGGCAVATPLAVRLFDAVGFDVVVVETVGVGQSEVDVAALADVTLVVLAPGLGDDVQAEKAGILEVADVLVVNKADLAGADRLAADLEAMLRRLPTLASSPTVVPTTATTGDGVDALVDAVDHATRVATAAGSARRRTAAMLVELVLERHRRQVREDHAPAVDGLAADVLAGVRDPFDAADELAGMLAARARSDGAGAG